MKVFWIIIIGLGAAWLLQSVLSLRQMKNFSNVFVAMRKDGPVVIGKFQGAIASGAIVLFVIDEEGRIRYGRRLHGVTVMASFRDFPIYDGTIISKIDPSLARKCGKSMVKAVTNAQENYRIISGGGIAKEPQTPLGRLLASPSKFRRRKPAEVTG